MAEITKPSGLNKIWAATGTISTPSDLKISTGNIVEKPAYDYFNFWQNRVDTFNAFMNQHGYPTWDADTEYQAEKSYVMHSNGTVYRCIVTHTNQAIPNATYWEIAFSDYGSSYTKAEADALYLAKASNLSDLNNPVTARTNLSVYSKAEMDAALAQAGNTTYGRVKIANIAEGQALLDTYKVLTPYVLSFITATETSIGLVEKATEAEAKAFTANKYIDGERLGQVFAAKEQVLHVRDEKSSGTNGGTFTSGAWRTRDLNTVVENSITGASLSSNLITLPAGTYRVRARAPASSVGGHKALIYNSTGAANLVIGAQSQGSTSGTEQIDAWVIGKFTLATTSNIALVHQCTSSQATTGFGVAMGFGVNEVYSEVCIEKVV